MFGSVTGLSPPGNGAHLYRWSFSTRLTCGTSSDLRQKQRCSPLCMFILIFTSVVYRK